jgi:exopolysaccharide biosynthesis WecB/TagA/CpsF family protein
MINTVPKYLYTASTCWDFDDKVLKSYIDKGYRFIYDYLDALSPELAGTDKIPVNVEKIHNYVINNVNNAFVVTTADSLYEDMLKKRKTDKNLVFACNGVNIEDFQKLNKKVVLEDRFKEVIKKGKVIGYYGALASWFDYDLVKYIAKKRPEYNIVLIGAKYDTSFDKENLNEYENIHYFEPKKYYELPYYAKHFDVCTLPFVLNEITYSTNPIKIFEYMAMGKPIVSTDLKECRKYKSVNIGHTKEEFLNLIDKQLENNDQNYKNILKKEAKENTWEEKAKTIVIGLKSYEKENNHQSNDDALSEIFYKIYQQNYSEDVKTKLSKDIVKKNKLFIITINSELCVKAQENPKYKDILLRKEVLLVPDSISISYVMKKSFKQKLKRYPGIELLVDMLKEANRQHKSIYLYGGTKKVNDDMTKYVKKNYKDIKVLGSKDGYNHSDKDVEKDILKLKPDMVVVALGVPKQELFINDIYDKVNKGIFIGVGGSFDVLSGNTKRAPKLLRKINLEWLYRIVKDPKRFGRFYDNNIKFIFERKKKK